MNTRPLLASADTGELVETTMDGLEDEVITLRDQVRELQRTIRRQARELGDNKRDRQKEAEEDPLWPQAVKLHQLYNRVTGHRSVWKLDCWQAMEPFLHKYEIEVIEAAIHGLHLDHYVTVRKNGTKRHHDGWHLLFRDTSTFEERVNSAPREMLEVLKEEGLLPGMKPKRKGSVPAQRTLLPDTDVGQATSAS